MTVRWVSLGRAAPVSRPPVLVLGRHVRVLAYARRTMPGLRRRKLADVEVLLLVQRRFVRRTNSSLLHLRTA